MIINNFSNHPTPQTERKGFFDLCGKWDFKFDSGNNGEKGGLYNGFIGEYEINVPFTYESEKSGVGIEEPCENVWYQKKFAINAPKNKRVILNFEGADYVTKVWLNGKFVGSSVGAYHAFSFDITDIIESENLLVVKCEDSLDPCIIRGKQRAKKENYACFYTQMTGIWKPVWIDFVGDSYLKEFYIRTEISKKLFCLKYTLNKVLSGETLEVKVLKDDKVIKSVEENVVSEIGEIALNIATDDNIFWGLNGGLYRATITIKTENSLDEVYTYFGLRDIGIRNNAVCLNNSVLNQNLLLYQGIHKDGLYTAPDDERIIKELSLIKEAGYNGIRIHEKTETERFMYFADLMGLVVWCEIPSAYEFGEKLIDRYLEEMSAIIKQKRNHPSVITWVLFNESWGIGEIASDDKVYNFTQSMYYLAKSLDDRPVIVNDGWEHTSCDVITIHNYTQDADVLFDNCKDLTKSSEKSIKAAKKPVFVRGFKYNGQPIIVSEYGGCCMNKDVNKGWGYGLGADGEEDFLSRYDKLRKALKKLKFLSGYCYTQFNDVQQEKNGIADEDGNMKVNLEKLKKINV